MIVTTAEDYATLIKNSKAPNQRESLWEQFLTGTQQQYQSAAQQVQAATSYDISGAYANYKQQQLQLMMNNQLGAGFKEQVSSGLQQQYETAYDKVKAQESSALATIATQYEKAVVAGEERFAELGEIARQYDKALHEYAQLAKVEDYDDMTKTYFDDQGRRVTEQTDYGRLWYHDVLNKEYIDPTTGEKMYFEDWLVTEDSGSELSYDERLKIKKALQQSPEIFANTVTGLTEDFDYKKIRSDYDTFKTEKERVQQIEDSEKYFTSEKTIINNFGSHSDKSSEKDLQASLTNIVKEYTNENAVVSIDGYYDKNRQKTHSTVVLDYASLTPEQQQAIKDGIGRRADAYIENGKITIKLTVDGKISAGSYGMSYTNFIRALKGKE